MDEAELFEHDASKVRFLDNVTTTWIDGPNSFPIPLWNKFWEDKLKTNNLIMPRAIIIDLITKSEQNQIYGDSLRLSKTKKSLNDCERRGITKTF